MRSFRCPVLGLALLSALPTIGSAQAGRLFKDSWFWGAKTGVMSYSTKAVENAVAPLFGGEWLITRTRGALYVSYDQTFFNNDAAIDDATSTGGQRLVEIDDMRRLTFAALAFPKNWLGLRPYAGVGMALNFIQDATPRGTYPDAAIQNDIEATVEDRRTRAHRQGTRLAAEGDRLRAPGPRRGRGEEAGRLRRRSRPADHGVSRGFIV